MQRTPEGTAATELILEAFRLNGQLLDTGDRLTSPLGLTSARWQVLGAIETEQGPLTVAQIGRRMGLSRQAVQRIVNELKDLGFVTLEDNPDHKRSKHVVLTTPCIQTLKQLDAIQTRWVNQLTAGLSERTIRQAMKLLDEIRGRCAALEQEAEQDKGRK